MNSITELVKKKQELLEEIQAIDEQVASMNSETHKELLNAYVGKCYKGIDIGNSNSYFRITRVYDTEKNHVAVEHFYIDAYHSKQIEFYFSIEEIDGISFIDYCKEITVKEYNKQFSEFLKRIKERK